MINNKQTSIWTPLLKMAEVARLTKSKLSRLRHFETVKYQGCRDRDYLRPRICKLSRLRLFETRKFGVVETEQKLLILRLF